MTDIEIALGRDEVLSSPALQLIKTSSPDCVTEAPDAYLVLTRQLIELATSKPTLTPRPLHLRIYVNEQVTVDEEIPLKAPWAFLTEICSNHPKFGCWRFQESLVIYVDASETETETFWVITRFGRT
jgi:hypothetical protein